MIRIVDYGVGNAQAFINILNRMGIHALRAKTPDELLDADFLILPGVGHFDHAIQQLNNSGLRPKLEELVLGLKIPILGICVGMQILADGSDEGVMPGLGWVPGHVKAFSNQLKCKKLPMPHMGWNVLKPANKNSFILSNLDASAQFYFLHSYYFDAADKRNVIAISNYGFDFDAVVSHGNIHGVQCHIEKSHHWGGQVLKNFLGKLRC